MNHSRKLASLVGIASAIVLTAGIAAAFTWDATAVGDGKAKADTMSFTVAAGTPAADGDLFPGSVGDVVFQVTNPNPFQITVTAAAKTGDITSTVAACVNDLTFTDVTGLTQTVAGNGGTATLTLDNKLAMGEDAEDTCQGATFTVPLTVTAVQSAATP